MYRLWLYGIAFLLISHFTKKMRIQIFSEEVILEENTTLCWVVIFKIYLTCCCKYLKNSASCRIQISSQQQKLKMKRKHRSSLATWVSIFTLSLHIAVSSFLLLVWTVCWCQSLLWHLPASLPLQNSVLFHMNRAICEMY